MPAAAVQAAVVVVMPTAAAATTAAAAGPMLAAAVAAAALGAIVAMVPAAMHQAQGHLLVAVVVPGLLEMVVEAAGAATGAGMATTAGLKVATPMLPQASPPPQQPNARPRRCMMQRKRQR